MKLFYTLLLFIAIWNLSAQGIEMDYNLNSPSIIMKAQYDSIESIRGADYFDGGEVSIELIRTDSSHSASILFDLTTQNLNDEELVDIGGEVEESWIMGIDGDDQFRFIHYLDENLLLTDIPKNQDIIVFDADEDGSHSDPIVKIPQGRLYIGDDIKLSTSSENQLKIAGGDVVPISYISEFGIKQYDLGKDGSFSHWGNVVANDFVTYSGLPEISFVKANTSSLDVLEGIKTYRVRDKNIGVDNRMMLNPPELKKVFPEALHLQDIQHNPDGTTELVEIENPGIIYDRFIPLLIDGMQEQQELINKQAAYIKSIEARLLKLEGK